VCAGFRGAQEGFEEASVARKRPHSAAVAYRKSEGSGLVAANRFRRGTDGYAAGVTKSSRIRKAADDPCSTSMSRTTSTAARMMGSLFSSKGRP
jgi:hypothetical protein